MQLLAVLLLASVAHAQKTPDKKGAIVHLFEWRWNDIALECERFLAPYGYGGVQVSPPTENVIVKDRPWYERYQPISYKLVTRSGNEEQFKEMVRRCNKVGVRIYVDAVINHMTGDVIPAVGTGGSTADPAHRSYPAIPYGQFDFNDGRSCPSRSGGIENYGSDVQVRNCELVGLHDLNQGKEYVRGKIVELLNRLIDYGVAGFRLDACKHMWPGDLEIILSQMKNLSTEHSFPPGSRPVIFQEVIDLGSEAISATQYTKFGRVTEFRYGKHLGDALRGYNKLKWFDKFGAEWRMLPSGDALVFVDNHDNQRGHGAGGGSILTYKEARMYKMAVAFMLSWTYGFPRVMSSFDFQDSSQGPPHNADYSILPVLVNSDMTCGNGWVCEHRWRQIYNMVLFRNIVDGSPASNWWTNHNNQIAYCRGKKGFVAINAEKNNDLKETLQTCLPPGTYCDVISGSKVNGTCTGKIVQVRQDGKADILIKPSDMDGVMAFHVESKL